MVKLDLNLGVKLDLKFILKWIVSMIDAYLELIIYIYIINSMNTSTTIPLLTKGVKVNLEEVILIGG